MASGQLIQYSNFSNADASSYDTGEGHNNSVYLYASGAAIFMRCSCNSVALRTASYTVRASYYNWSTSSWVQAWSDSQSVKGAGGARDSYFYHNYNGSNTLGDNSRSFNLWRFQFSASTPGSCTARIRCYVGGPGRMGESFYNSFCQGKLIASAGRLGSDWMHASSSQDDATALSLFRWSSNTGTLLYDSYKNKFIPKNW